MAILKSMYLDAMSIGVMTECPNTFVRVVYFSRNIFVLRRIYV